MAVPVTILVRDLATGAVRARVYPAAGETLYAAAARAGVPWRTRCRGSTICGLCWVRVDRGDRLAPPEPDEREVLRIDAPADPRARLACRLVVPEGVSALEVAAPAP